MIVMENIGIADLDKLYHKAVFCWEGTVLDSDNLSTIELILKHLGNYDEDIIKLLIFNGKLVNEKYKLTGNNAYKDDLIFIAVPDYYDDLMQEYSGARWFNDIVNENKEMELKQNETNKILQ